VPAGGQSTVSSPTTIVTLPSQDVEALVLGVVDVERSLEPGGAVISTRLYWPAVSSAVALTSPACRRTSAAGRGGRGLEKGDA
jgi:hypothetical protein